jgi:hypothetical protein
MSNDHRLAAVLDHAARVLRERAGECLAQAVDTLDLRAKMAQKAADREPLIEARTALIEGAERLMPRFESRLRDEMNRLVEAPVGEGTNIRFMSESLWDTLTLVDDDQVERDIAVARLTQAVASAAETELRELTSCMAALLVNERSDIARHPLRADVPALALVDAVGVAIVKADLRATLLKEVGPAFAREVTAGYGLILADIRARGIKPVLPAVPRTPSRPLPMTAAGGDAAAFGAPHATAPASPQAIESLDGHAHSHADSRLDSRLPSGYPTRPPGANAPRGRHVPGGHAPEWSPASRFPTPVRAPAHPSGAAVAAMDGFMHSLPPSFSPTFPSTFPASLPPTLQPHQRSAAPASVFPSAAAGAQAPGAWPNLTLIDPQPAVAVAQSLLRTPTPSAAAGLAPNADAAPAAVSPRASAAASAPPPAAPPVDDSMLQVLRQLQAQAWAGLQADAAQASSVPPANMVLRHRASLEQLASTAVDSRVIDLVGQVFEEVVNDRRVPLEMAREIARLQLAVLRLALKDSEFFATREHPARRLLDRLAALASAVEDLTQPAGRALVGRAQQVVAAVLAGDFGSRAIYEQQLAELDRFAREHARLELEKRAAVPSLLAEKEAALRAHANIQGTIRSGLAAVDTPAFIVDFLVDGWSHVLVDAQRHAQRARSRAEDADPSLADASGDAEELGYQVAPGRRQLEPAEQWLARVQTLASHWILGLKPKAGATDRQKELAALPALMRDAREALRRVGWKAEDVQGFLHRWMPQRAQALKGTPTRDLDHNLLARDLQTLWAQVLAAASQLRDVSAQASQDPAQAVPAVKVAPAPTQAVCFAPEQAQRIGWVPDDAWPQAVRTASEVPQPPVVMVGAMARGPGTVSEPTFAPTAPDGLLDDSTLPMPLQPARAASTTGSGQQPVAAARPTPSPLAELAREAGVAVKPAEVSGPPVQDAPGTPEETSAASPAQPDPGPPSRGAALADHLRVGEAYDLLVSDRRRRVRLAHLSPGGAFVVFTHGAQQEQTITMTSRMMRQACESGRLQAAESSSMIDRASERLTHRWRPEPPVAAAVPAAAQAAAPAPAPASPGIDRWLRQPS